MTLALATHPLATHRQHYPQVAFQRILEALGSVDERVLKTGTDLELLAALPDLVLPYILLSILLAITMHDRDAASRLLGIDTESAFASANGVGGGSWQARPSSSTPRTSRPALPLPLPPPLRRPLPRT